MNKFWKIVIFNGVFSVVCIVLFSPGLVALAPSLHNLLRTALFFAALIGAFATFIFVNYALLNGKSPEKKKVKIVDNSELAEPKDYVKALQSYAYKKDFEKVIGVMTNQIKRITPKQASLEVILEQSFDKGEMTYVKYKTTIDEVMGLFYDNVKKALNRIAVFDENEFKMLKTNQLNMPDESKKLKINIYKEHISYINGMAKRNEYIITLIDNLILEISKLDELNNHSVEDSQILAEMKKLIDDTKLYA